MGEGDEEKKPEDSDDDSNSLLKYAEANLDGMFSTTRPENSWDTTEVCNSCLGGYYGLRCFWLRFN